MMLTDLDDALYAVCLVGAVVLIAIMPLVLLRAYYRDGHFASFHEFLCFIVDVLCCVLIGLGVLQVPSYVKRNAPPFALSTDSVYVSAESRAWAEQHVLLHLRRHYE